MTEAAMEARTGELTQLARAAGAGDRGAYDRLFALAYEQLYDIAGRQLRRDARRPLDPGELVSELYLKMERQVGVDWADRAHFYAVAARAMRQILTDMARRRQAAKRGADADPTTLSGKGIAEAMSLDDLLALDDALAQLEERQRRVVELRFFGGVHEDEIAKMLGVTTRTVQRDWTKARAWLYRTLYEGGAKSS